MNFSVFDIETDNLLDEVTLIHCLSAKQYKDGQVFFLTFTNTDEIKNFVLNETTLVGHNIIKYDVPVLEKLLNIKITARLVDTLGLSWYLYQERLKHGLEEWGEDLGVSKPIINDWKNLTIEEYCHRCQTDVEINDLLFNKQISYLTAIYNGVNINKLIDYITFKLECAREQEEVRWRLDEVRARSVLEMLNTDRDTRLFELSKVMPPKANYKESTIPKVLYKKDGSLSSHGEKWFNLLKEYDLPENYVGKIKQIKNYEPGNGGSPDQVKDWLYSLGWKPQTFRYEKNKDTGEVRAIEQISADGKICPSVKLLFDQEPGMVHLEGLSIIKHRSGILKGFLRDVKDGRLQARVQGFTNTMRFQHTEIVNLPTVHKPYGKDMRGCLIADEGMLLCGSDMSSLEDSTKRHYMWAYDPEYVKEMSDPDFDPHLDIAIQGAMLTIAQVQAHKNKIEDHSSVRKDAKQVNFSAVYGVGASKLSLTTGWPMSKSKSLLEIYWKRNWSVKAIARDTTYKIVDGNMWLYNPVSQLWYPLRYEKDKFSTLNQGTGVWCFDTWVKYVRKSGIRLSGQFHDEIAFNLKPEDQEEVKQKLLDAIQAVNDELKLNVKLGISIDFGENYAAIH